MIHICAGKILVQENIATVDRYVHLVHIFSNESWHGMAPQGIIYMSKLKNTQKMKYVWLTIKLNYFVLPAYVGVSYVATQFHVKPRLYAQFAPWCKFTPGCKIAPGSKFAPPYVRSYVNKLCSYVIGFAL